MGLKLMTDLAIPTAYDWFLFVLCLGGEGVVLLPSCLQSCTAAFLFTLLHTLSAKTLEALHHSVPTSIILLQEARPF
jgi:hypothetical protein